MRGLFQLALTKPELTLKDEITRQTERVCLCLFFFQSLSTESLIRVTFMGNTTQERNTGKNFTFKKPIKGTFVCCTHLWTVYGKHEATLLARGWEGHDSPNLQFKSTLQVTIWFDLIWFLSQTFLFCHCLSFTSRNFFKILFIDEFSFIHDNVQPFVCNRCLRELTVFRLQTYFFCLLLTMITEPLFYAVIFKALTSLCSSAPSNASENCMLGKVGGWDVRASGRLPML